MLKSVKPVKHKFNASFLSNCLNDVLTVNDCQVGKLWKWSDFALRPNKASKADHIV